MCVCALPEAYTVSHFISMGSGTFTFVNVGYFDYRIAAWRMAAGEGSSAEVCASPEV